MSDYVIYYRNSVRRFSGHTIEENVEYHNTMFEFFSDNLKFRVNGYLRKLIGITKLFYKNKMKFFTVSRRIIRVNQ